MVILGWVRDPVRALDPVGSVVKPVAPTEAAWMWRSELS